jgi:periplasmic protein TonB
MSKLNINRKEWLELVFEGKNKAYGAYQLRQEEKSTTMKAFTISMLLMGSLIFLGISLSSFDELPVTKEPEKWDPVTPVTLFPKRDEPKKNDPEPTAEKTPTNLPPKVVKAVDVPEEDPITETPTVNQPTDTGNSGSTGANSGKTQGGDDIPVIETPKFNPDEIVTSVDKNPYFPGGLNLFLKEVGKKFIAPELEEEKTLKVIVLFVVERDGSLSNIKVADDPGFGMGEEAIRVLKSIKTKWEPGIYKGQKVRTTFSLPILVKVQAPE